MQLIKQKANEVAAELHSKHGHPKAQTFDIGTILAVIQIILALVRLAKLCRQSNKRTLDNFRNPNIINRRRIARVVARYAPYGLSTVNLEAAVLSVGSKLTEEELVLLYKEEGELK